MICWATFKLYSFKLKKQKYNSNAVKTNNYFTNNNDNLQWD